MADLDTLLDALADRIAERVAARTAPRSADEFFTAKNPPPGMSGRAFSDWARKGSFPSFKMGRALVARRRDVLDWLEAHRSRKPGTRLPPTTTDRTELLRAAGLRPSDKPGE